MYFYVTSILQNIINIQIKNIIEITISRKTTVFLKIDLIALKIIKKLLFPLTQNPVYFKIT